MARKRVKEEQRPDLTPMIDVVFQLLIFFMVTAVFAITPGLDIKLPEAEEAQAPEKSKPAKPKGPNVVDTAPEGEGRRR